MNSLAISIVVWNNSDDALECADSLLAQTIADRVQILFVDNDSDSATVQRLTEYIDKKKDDRLVLIHTGYNGGTAGGFTAAAKWAESEGVEYIGALNADAVAEKDWCESLLRELEQHPDAGIAAGIVLHRDGQTVDSTGEFYTTWGIPGPRERNRPVSEASSEPEYIFGVTGGAFLCRTSIYKTVGYYDEIMFMYYEDLDFSFRAQLYGYKVRYSPKAVVYHKRGASADTVPGLAVYNTFKNLPILYVKNVPLSLGPTIYPRFVLAYSLILANAIKNGKGVPAIKGWLMSWRYLVYMFSERRNIQKNRTVTDNYISSIIVHDILPEQTGLRKFRKVFTGR
jgi:GT2 family glycosyltransferase